MATTTTSIKGPTATNVSNSNPPGHKIPHLIKWIKHKVNKKENRYTTRGRSYTSEDVENIVGGNGLSSVSKETLQDSGSSLLDSTQDSIDTNLTSFSGNTIVSDSSYEIADINNKTKGAVLCTNNSRILSNPSSANIPNSNSTQSHNNMGVVRTSNQNTVVRTSNQNNLQNSTGMDINTCKHGYLTNRCRLCMQLPPLPPGSERVLRELQRQAKQKLRSQSQVHFSSTGNIHCSPELSRNVSSINANKSHIVNSMNTFQSHGHSHSMQRHQFGYMQEGITRNTHFTNSNVHNSNAPFRTMSVASPRPTATSPEHVYEEIPSSFFSNDHLHQHHQTNVIQTILPNNIPVSDMDIRYNRGNFGNFHNGRPLSFHGYHTPANINSDRGDRNNKPNVSSARPEVSAKTELKSHEFYPQNMHCNQAAKRPSPSKQVSLGNLDFGMAKECDGFLVVPLRDRSSNSSTPQTGNVVNDTTHQRYWVKDQANVMQQQHMDSGSSHGVENVNSSIKNVNSGITNVNSNIHNRPVLQHSNSYHHVNHDSGFQDGGSNVDLRQQYHEKAHAFQPIYSHGRTHSMDAVISETSEKFSHCKRCKRPHALYHGVSLCHSDVEDMRQELQYLDIAGLDKNKLRGATSVLSSHSLLQNFARRRSAFSKYIPSSQKEGDDSKNDYHNTENDDALPNEDCNMRNDEADSHLSDSFKRQSMSTESDYFSKMTDSFKRQSMSTESDYFSSNYNTSLSDTLSRASREYHAQSKVNYVTSSDRSNDTFSEYDVKSDYLPKREDSGSVEYNFYLAKVKQNLQIKQEVRKIIRSSESEKSDCERSYQSDSNFLQDDSISLTSVTSLSELSTMPMDDSSASFIRSRVHNKVNKGSPKSSKTHSSSTSAKVQNIITADNYVSKMQRVRKPIRKKRKSQKDVEYYKLPNFAPNATFQNYDSKTSSDSSSRRSEPVKSSSNQETKLNGAVKVDRSNTPSDKQDSSSCYSLDSVKSSEKLSCRVTDFKMSDIKRTNSFSNINKTLSVRATTNDQSEQKATRSSVYSNHNQVKNNANNRLLSDLMRMNHDRQLFSFI